MKVVYELYYPGGIELSETEPSLPDTEWYRIRKHVCRHDEGKPCDPWEVVAEYGDVPESDEE